MIFLFIHGGPGLNSGPEENILKTKFDSQDEVYFWNEPSISRKTNNGVTSFADCCRSLITEIRRISLDSKITVIAHSFGGIYINAILPSVENLLNRIILITPVSNITDLDRNIITLSAEDETFPQSDTLQKYLSVLSEKTTFSAERYEHLLVAASNPNLASQYWFQKSLMPSYFMYMVEDGQRFDLSSFKSIRETCNVTGMQNISSLPVDVIYGLHDQIIKISDKDFVERVYKNSTFHIFQESAHYCHIEQCDEFMQIIYTNKSIRQNQKYNLLTTTQLT